VALAEGGTEMHPEGPKWVVRLTFKKKAWPKSIAMALFLVMMNNDYDLRIYSDEGDSIFFCVAELAWKNPFPQPCG
jgi:hypothetical protein